MAKRLRQKRSPMLSRLLIILFAPQDDLDAVMGDLEEEFCARAVLQSLASARIWHWQQTIASVPYWLRSKSHGGAMAVILLGVSGYSLIMCWEYLIAIVGISPG